MKKTFLFLTAILIFSATACNIINIDNKDPVTTIEAPATDRTTSGITITPSTKNAAGIQYMNIFRYEVTTDDGFAEIVEGSERNIGEIYVKNQNNSAWIFVDYYTSDSKLYQYYIRYKNEHQYLKSETTKTIRGVKENGEKVITNNDEEAATFPIQLDEGQYVLSLDSTLITMPSTDFTDEYFSVMVAIDNDVETLLFKMTEDQANQKYTLSLRNVLPRTFFDTKLKVKYVVGQRVDSKTNGQKPQETPDYYRYHWTDPYPTLLYKDGNSIDDFIIYSSLGDLDPADFTPSRSASENEVSDSEAQEKITLLY